MTRPMTSSVERDDDALTVLTRDDSFPVEDKDGTGGPVPIMKSARSENKLQAELHRARASRTHGRIGGGDVGSGTAASEAAHGRIIEAETILAAVWIGEVGMVENVEELRPELGTEALAEMPVLRQGEVHVAETGIRENVASHGAELPECRRDHNGVAFGITAKQVECGCRSAGRSTI